MSYNKKERSLKRYMDFIHIVKQEKIYNYYNNSEVKKVGKFRKQKAMNCGRSGCCMCGNQRHLFGYVTLAETKQNINFKEFLKEI